jgi:hypothetical protein
LEICIARNCNRLELQQAAFDQRRAPAVQRPSRFPFIFKRSR